jgi:predicted ATP-dependent endonuclease of OLD family
LINVASRYNSKKEKKKEKDFTPSMTLLLFEEPEAFLHPPQQDILARSLMTVSKSENKQVICSTHSPHFVSRNSQNILGLIHFERKNGIVSTFQITEKDWDDIVDANLMINKIAEKYKKMKNKLAEEDKKPEMEAVKQFLWLNPDRCGLFFANHVLLVEGPTEVGLINKLIGDGKIKKSEYGLYVLDCLGKYNIHRFMNMIALLGINHSVIFDDDNNKDEHQDINQLIEDTRNSSLTFKIVKIPGELESYLKVKCPCSDHRKPQHMLYLYETGGIDIKKIDAFCKIVDSCIP